LDTLHLHTRSAWLLGRDERVADYVLEESGASKQHAVVQFRYISKTDEFGAKTGRVKPYLIDLESARGTRLNGEKIAAGRYVELVDGDVVAFGEGEREFVVMLPKAEKGEKS
jgi:smad nuclear-interacting protein 1